MSKLKYVAALAAVAAVSAWAAAPAGAADSIYKQCGAEWKTAKDTNATNGQSWKDFLKDCKARHAATPAAAAPAATPAAAAPAPSPTPTKVAKLAPAAAPAAPTGAGEFSTEGEAKGRCPSDTVVWVNTKSHKYHYSGHRSYGHTKQGAYMCEADAKAGGDVAAKGEKPK